MKVLTFSRQFPKGHPKAGQPTWFVEKILICLNWGMTGQELLNSIKPEIKDYVNDFSLITEPRKFHTIRAGSRFKPGEMVSLRVWSDKPYRSKQIEFAQVEVRKTHEFIIHKVENTLVWQVKGSGSGNFNTESEALKIIARNDGLEVQDFIDWFNIHPKRNNDGFRGQIICWNESIEYK